MKYLFLVALISSSNLVHAQGMLQNIDQKYSYFKLKKNGQSKQMRIFECLKSNCAPLIHNDENVCFNFNPVTEKEVKLYYRSGFNLLNQKLLDTIGLFIRRHNPNTMLVGISNKNEFEATINTQIGNKLRMISTQIPAIVGATNWMSKFNNIRFISVFEKIITKPVTVVVQSKDAQGNIVEEYKDVPADLRCDK